MRDRYIIVISLLAISILFGIAGTVLGIIALARSTNDSSSSSSETRIYTLPPQAIMIDDSTYSISYPEHGVYGIAIVTRHHNDTNLMAKRARVPPPGSSPQKVVHTQCLGNINPNTRWRSAEEYVVDTDNDQGLSASFISSSAAAAASMWSKYIAFKPFGKQVVGHLSGGTSFTGVNGLAFGAIDIPGATHAIAVTVVYWSCPGGRCSYIEWKMIFNTVNYPFGSSVTGDTSVIDLLNTDTHEFGHVLGCIDLHDSTCSEDTMFFSEGYGERKKITLEDDDIYNVRFVIGYGDSGALRTGNSIKREVSALAYAMLVAFIIL